MQDIVCEQCGGVDFYKEAGFYFCSGCQIQSQEVQEYVYDEYTPETRLKTKKIQSDKTAKTENKITSWECYNYILLGLTNELINLGANKKLKAVVRLLWMRYLEKLQVFKLGRDELPKLQAVCSNMDAEIVYGKLAKKKRKRNKSSSSELDVTSLDSTSLKHERVKRKRALAKAQYEEFSKKSQETPSLHNETLTSLQTGSEKSSKNAVPIKYNIYATKELRKIKSSQYHWRKHRRDFERNLKCHKLSYRKISGKYRASPYILSINKLYAILYLGLLITKSKVQLSDILRFIKEGHLSFNYYSHFFPEDFVDKTLNFRNFKKNTMFVNAPFRTIAAEMSVLLQIDFYISCPNLIELCERYCGELNLPREICDCAKNIITRADIKMSFRKRNGKIPNYEGRVLSVILFVLKLLFGLDDVTEFHLANYSNILNNSEAVRPKMFNIIDWLKYIEYRDLVMNNQHFPTSFHDENNFNNVNLALSALGRKDYSASAKPNSTSDNYKQLFEKLKNYLDVPDFIEFPVTFTPFLDYAKQLPKSDYLEILSRDFSSDSLAHVLKPIKFLQLVNEPEVVNGGANEDWVVEKLTCFKEEQHREKLNRRKLVTVKLSFDTKVKPTKETLCEDATKLKTHFQEANERHFKRNLRQLNYKNYLVVDYDLKQIEADLESSADSYPRHYNPYERFWMRSRIGIEDMSHEQCRDFVKKFPYNFRLVFKECRRIAEQNDQEFLVEYNFTELYLIHMANFGKKKQTIIKNKLIAHYLDKNVSLW
ncbi:hypothetical protein TcasGA2_TC010961 [Tribolium castaneum]|uniref:Rrn7/TAF1B C-terminal cyclin domain-containing protein n=1 Tax=Tribolium castaneum TaxID=7070 RepID=D6X1I3_TRICA|nr:PREDICTED: TATA box-binding protein-associated factor RNA polymerase I subunit B isoform X1 [Tribolium castaneum]EFA09467.1 hypothetical protein TcasGA2_TC010961 [Tribolium castaneum]|eukprot:XP_008199650.1 PREDICTED: TATA box-binding protein-associated factor RNA polymerase I subunit B isoform X1 [Tribolium castaneum]